MCRCAVYGADRLVLVVISVALVVIEKQENSTSARIAAIKPH